MAPEEQLRWEDRFAKPAAAASVLAALFIVAGTVVRQAVALSDSPDDEREFLIAIDENAGSFLASGPRSEARAEDLLEDRSVAAAAVGSGGTLAIAIAFVLININAMRVGLLSRFMGIIGAIIGGLYVLPILSGPLIVELFWLIAIAVLFLGHWPGGRGPAWEKVEAIPWPSGAEVRQKALETVEPPSASDAQPEETAPPAKRKRKRR